LLPPTPDEENVSFSGSFLASAISSAGVLAATLGFTASTYWYDVVWQIGASAASVSIMPFWTCGLMMTLVPTA
jgi:hypothetical protein